MESESATADDQHTKSSGTRKRQLSDSQDHSAVIAKKTASIFQNAKTGLILNWLEPLAGTCLHGVCGDPKPSSKIAAFDIDGTLIRVKSGKKFPSNADDWKLWSNNVPKKLQETHAQGYAIVLLSNQNHKSPKNQADFEAKLIQVARTFGVPLRVFAAREKDRFRKPLTGMWDEFVSSFNGAIKPILEDCFFVGDAAGRISKGSVAKDWNDTDRKFALNIGIPFFTPEEWFAGEATRTDFVLSGFDPLKHDDDQPVWHPSTTPLARSPSSQNPTDLKPSSTCEIVLFVGPPAVGKTTCFETYFLPHEYQHVNQDTLKSFDKCLKAVTDCITRGKSCVVDNTNPTKKIRLEYVRRAQELGCQIRCVEFTASTELAQHNNVYRACIKQSRPLLPTLAFTSYAKNFESPSVDEGFLELKKVNFIFHGDPAERSAWQKYLL